MQPQFHPFERQRFRHDERGAGVDIAPFFVSRLAQSFHDPVGDLLLAFCPVGFEA